jgi:hypothetical protein
MRRGSCRLLVRLCNHDVYSKINAGHLASDQDILNGLFRSLR